MRWICIIPLFLLGLACSGSKDAAMKYDWLDGTWVPVKQEFGGKPLPAAAFQKQSLVISDSSYTVTAESVDKGTLVYGANKMDIYGKEGPNAGKHITAIYKFENDQLTICYNLAGDSYPEAFTTKGEASLFLSVFKKEGMN